MNALSLLIKPASSNCNMRCRYCFYADIADHRDTANYGMMTAETAETLIRKCMDEAEAFCSFAFQGGEPTLAGLDFFRTFVSLVNQYNTKNIPVRYALQTNGLVIDAEWAKFFSENKFLVGLSIDAGRERHDAMRIDASGMDTHKRCLDAARILREGNVDFNILCVLTRGIASHPDKTYRYYKEKGFRYLQFIPCIDSLDSVGEQSPHSLDAERYGKFLCRLFDLWYRDFNNGEYISIRMFDNYIHMLAGHPPENCAMAGRCRTYLLIEADGSVFPCDFYALDEYRLGSVQDDSLRSMLTGEVAKKFVTPSHDIHADCVDCEYFMLCRGGCRRDREPVVNDVPARNIYCSSYKMLFAHALPRMAEIAKKAVGRAPS